MVGELGTFWWLGQLGQVWVKYGRSGEMYWGVGGGKGRCVGGVGSVLGCGKVWGGVGMGVGVWKCVWGVAKCVWDVGKVRKGCWGGGNVGGGSKCGKKYGTIWESGKMWGEG